MDSLIPVINQLQDVCNTATIPLPIDLPQIVVIGNQSSGKSSVIESIVRREFLPRGVGTVTRRPLEIRLIKVCDDDIKRKFEKSTHNNHNHQNHLNTNGNGHCDENSQHDVSMAGDYHDADSGFSDYSGDWVKFGHLPDKIFTNFEEVRKEIEDETDRICGTNNGINSKPITLNVYSKNVVNLTLVDLPGLIYFPTGDQPKDIEDQVRGLIEKYIKKPNCIILTVIAANHDFATSEAIKIAYDYDKKRKRTLAVLTKLDLIEPGVDALSILTGKLVNIKLGIIGVVNRSQADKKTFAKAIEDEKKFLHEHYPSIADRNGQPYLSRRLSQLLMDHIKACLPQLRMRINTLLSEYQDKLHSYGEEVTDKDNTIINAIQKISTSFCVTIKGGDDQIKASELCGGARIQYILHDSFGEALTRIDPLEALNNKAILTIARNIAGYKRAISVPHTFDYIITKQISRLEEPSLRCVELVHQELVRFVKSSCDQIDIIRFPKLREKIEEILIKLLDDRLPITKEAVKNSIKCYSAFIDTEHPTLREPSYYQPKAQDEGASNMGGDDGVGYDFELKECSIIAGKINNYFNIIKQMVKLSVPGAIMHFMVNHVMSNVHTLLIKSLHQKELFDALLTESNDIAQRRIETSEMIVTLKKANEILDTIQDQK